GNYSGTLVNALLYHCRGLSRANGPVRAGIVHRLDKETSGLMVVAKDDQTHAALARQFEQRTVNRSYWAVVWGLFPDPEGLIEADLGRSRSDRKKMAVIEGGKPAATEYTVLEEFRYLSLIQLRLRTGRTHQIRVHLSHIHHPVFGDPTYNGRRIMWGGRTPRQRTEVQSLLKVLPRQALHAKTIGFKHPGTNEELHFDSELPEDILLTLRNLRDFEARA
ncbi:MAG: RluA family pseudouridine synthase, partial [Bacteroidetes bacterium]|nr:RluA family pseudouridine synthase [Bacteroidota bacterium]